MPAAGTGAPAPAVVSGGGIGALAVSQFIPSVIEEGIDHLYAVTLGPVLRQTTNRVVHEPYTSAYKPPNTPGMVAREEVANYGGNVIFGALLKWLRDASPLRSRVGSASAINLAASALGSQGANATRVGAAVGSAAQAAEYRLLAGRYVFYFGGVTLFNAMVASHMGPWIEDHVNSLFGVKSAATTTTEIRGGVNPQTVKQTFEQGTRLFARSLSQALEGTVAMGAFGIPMFRALRSRITAGMVEGGAARVAEVGAVAALEAANPIARMIPVALAATASVGAVSAVSGVLNWAMGDQLANGAQRLARVGETLLHRPLATNTPPDIVQTVGDRVAYTTEYSLLIPGLVSLMTRDVAGYVA